MKGRYFSIRTKLIFMSLSVIAALAICGIMLYVENGQTNAFIRQAFLRQNTLNAYIDEISNMDRALRGYLSEHNEENYCNYLDSCSRLQRRVSDLTQQFQSRLALDQYKMTLGLLDKAKVLVFINDTMHQDTVLVDYEQNIALIIESYPLLMKDMGQVVQHTYERLTNTLLQRHIYVLFNGKYLN